MSADSFGNQPSSIRVAEMGGLRDLKPSTAVIELEGIYKSFGEAMVLRDVSITFAAGEVHALVGENGAGKSTIAKILAGALAPDQGHLRIDGENSVFMNPADAQRLGVTIIFQEPMLFPDLSVAENLFIGRQPRQSGRPWLNKSAMHERTRHLLTRIGSSVAPERLVRGLSVAEMQMVEIAAALSHDTRVLIVDEPTASLTPTEVENLFRILRDLRDRGTAILFIGHRLEEVFRIANTITVLRDGQVITTRSATTFTTPELIEAMVGRGTQGSFVHAPHNRTKGALLEIHGLSRSGVFKDISIDIHGGEIVGMAGLVGAGRSEIARAIFGIDKPGAGQVIVSGKQLSLGKPEAAISAGLAYVPEDRKAEGLASSLPISQNISILLSSTLRRFGWVQRSKEDAIASEFFRRLDVRAQSVNQPVAQLSGGNQQKVVLAKWLATDPKILILDEPTRGVDIGAKADIHKLIDGLARQGLGILMISSDLPEILAMSDRIVVIRDGQLAGTVNRGASASDILQLAVLNGADRDCSGPPS